MGEFLDVLEARSAGQRGVDLLRPVLRRLSSCTGSGVCGHYLACLAYAHLLNAWRQVYVGLEAVLDIARLDLPELRRLDDLNRDLMVLGGATWLEDVEPCRAAARYAARLVELATASPALLAGHLWVRYRGDVLGGMRAGVQAADLLYLPLPDGVRFFSGSEGSRLRLREGICTLPRLIDERPVMEELDRALAVEREIFSAFDEALEGRLERAGADEPEGHLRLVAGA